MKVKGFGAWPSRNVSTGGRRPLVDPFNKALKGDPYNKAYKKAYPPGAEYSSFGMDEYHHYDAQKDMTAAQNDSQAAEDKKRRDQQVKERSMRMRVMQQVVALVVGSTVLVTSYQAAVDKRALREAEAEPDDSIVDTMPDEPDDNTDNNDITPDEDPGENSTEPTEAATEAAAEAATEATGRPNEAASGSSSGSSGTSSDQNTSVSWSWSSDKSGASLIITDSSGRVISRTSAAVTAFETPASCTKAGKITRTATATANGRTYTDTDTEVLPALGHSFDDGTEITLSDGSTAVDFECTRCHEHFTIKNSVSEE